MGIKSAEITEKISFREKVRICKRTIQEVQLYAPSFIPTTVFRQILSVSQGYIGIYVSTMVINGLEQRTPAGELFGKAMLLLGIVFAMSLVSRFVEKYNNTIKDTVFEYFHGRRAVKAMELDYPDLEGVYIRELRSRMDTDNNWDNGFYGAFMRLEFFAYQFFNAVFAIVMLAPILHNILSAGSVLTYIFLGILLILLIAHAIGESYFDKRILKWMTKDPEKPEDIDLTWDLTLRGALDKYYKDIKIYGVRALLWEYLEEHGKKYAKERDNDMSENAGKRALVSSVLGAGTQGVCYFFITLMAAGGSVGIGMVVRYVACFERLTTGLQAMIRDLQKFLLVARRQSSTFEYLDAESSLYRGKLPVEKRSDNEYEIEFRNVSFRYPGSDIFALKNFSLKLRIGERMAVVGKNGSGKTTMIKLLSRLYDPTEGEILLNGIDIRKFDYHEYMKLFSIVFQDFSLFSFSIAKNVAASEEYDADRVEESLIKAGFGESLKRFPKGIETPIDKEYDDDGILVSGGERQKIAIARALYKDSPFILLDEPTAALDPIAEFEVYSAFNEMVGNKTAIYISHRLSSCRFCDDIVVFDKGQIVQRGNHEELMSDREGLYHTLWEAQAQYYEKPPFVV